MGITGGLNFSNIHISAPDAQETSNFTRVGIGSVLDLGLSEHFFIRIEPMFLQKGGRIEEGADPQNQPEGQFRFTFIEVPILIKYRFGRGVSPYLVAGPTVGYNIKSELQFEWLGLTFEGNMKEVTKKWDMGLVCGGGFQIPVKWGAIFIEGTYTFGIKNQQGTGTVDVSSGDFQFQLDVNEAETGYKNRGYRFMTGVLIRMNH